MDVIVQDEQNTALLDTGSMVSTISASLARKLNLEVKTLDDIIQLKGAAGQDIPYVGYVEVRLACDSVFDGSVDVLMLVVLDTSYHSRVPVLLGTNVLDFIKDRVLPSCENVWKLAFSCLSQQQTLSGNKECLGNVVSTQRITVAPRQKVVVHGQTRVKSVCQSLNICLEDVSSCGLPRGLMVSPSVGCIQPGNSYTRLPVEIVNISDREVTIPAKTPLCEVFNVEAVKPVSSDSTGDSSGSFSPGHNDGSSDEAFLSQFAHLSNTLSSKQVLEVQNRILRVYKDVFSQHDLDLGCTSIAKHHIKLRDPTQFKERPRRIPPSMLSEVKEHLQEMVDLGVIRRSQSPYASNVVIARNKNGKIRFCIDMRRLNSLTVRDAYSLPRIDDTLDALQGSCWFSALDLKSGYWQMEMAEEDKEKTAFTRGL